MGIKSHAILSAGADVSRSIFFAAAIIIAAFIPLFTLSGVEVHFRADGQDLRLRAGRRSARHLHRDPGAERDHSAVHMKETETRVMRILHAAYMPILRWAVGSRRIVMGIAAGLVVLTFVAGRLLGLEFLPKLEEGNLWIRATLPPTISLEEGNAYVNEMRKVIRAPGRRSSRWCRSMAAPMTAPTLPVSSTPNSLRR